MKTYIALSYQELTLIKNILKEYPNTVIFGSRAKGYHKKHSDVDIALKDPISSYAYEELREAFEDSDLPYTVDLVEYNKCEDYFKNIINQTGIKLFNKSEIS